MKEISRSAAAGGRSEDGSERRIIKGDKETFRGDRYIHYFDCSNDSIGIYSFKNLPNCTL